MKTLLTALGFSLLVATQAAGAAQKTFEGEEAAALRCANIIALTAVALNNVGRLSDIEKEAMLGISFLILEQHVSGTWAQKKAALMVVRDRRDVKETLGDFERLAEQCLRQFPIN